MGSVPADTAMQYAIVYIIGEKVASMNGFFPHISFFSELGSRSSEEVGQSTPYDDSYYARPPLKTLFSVPGAIL